MTASDPLNNAPELCRLGVAKLTAAYAAGTLSPVEVARACLARAEEAQAAHNAFTLIDHEAALAQARAAEARWQAGSPASTIDGVPTTIKDIVWVEDRAVGYGSVAAEPVRSSRDAPAVARLRAAGAVILGLTTTPEFGWKAVTDSPRSGVTTNPWNAALTPGGSSGGAAVAAATGAGVLHLGTDGGGSIRIPSSFSGIFGIKPTFGRVPAHPPSPFGSVSHVGPMARSPADAAAMLGVMAGRDISDWMQPPVDLPSLEGPRFDLRGASIGYWHRTPHGSVEPEVAARIDAVADSLRAEGALIEPIDLPDHDDLFAIFTTHWYAGAAARVAALPPDRLDRVDPGLRAVAAAGRKIPAPDYVLATQRRVAFGTAMDALLERFTLLLSPTTAVAAFAAGEEVPPGSGLGRWTEWAGFSYPINLSQQPACSLPCGRTSDGRPVGLQLVGPRGADARVLAAADGILSLI
jgi:amidase/aspartyl-tRNA(Asn)/glutamyl-tRNA(Gln) amidotransferase subunit A